MDRVLDRDRLIRDELGLDADRQVRRDLGHGPLDVLAQGQNVAAVAHGDREPDRGHAVDAEQGLGRVGVAARDLGDVAEADHPPVGDEVDAQDVLLGAERPGDADEQLLIARLDDAGRGHGVLSLQGGHQRLPVDPQARHLLGRELDVDFFILRAHDVDLGHVRHLQQARAHVLDIVLQLAMAEAVRREAVDDAVGVAELVVEAGPDDALRQGVADVADLLADLVPDVRDRLARRRALQVDEDRGLACAGVAAQIIEVRRLLELALQALRHLLERVLDRGAGPVGLHHHGPDREGRILVAPEPQV